MNKKMIIVIIALAFLLFLGLVGGGFYIMWTKLSQINATPQQTQQAGNGENGAAQPADAGAPTKVGPIKPIDTFIVNMADTERERYLKITLQLELSNAEADGEINKRMPQVKDLVLTFLPTKTAAELQSMEGKQQLREELMTKINDLLSTGRVTNIYFTDFVIQ